MGNEIEKNNNIEDINVDNEETKKDEVNNEVVNDETVNYDEATMNETTVNVNDEIILSEPVKEKKQRKYFNKKCIVIVACVCLSFVSGFAGATVSNYSLNKGSSQVSGNVEVIYQSVTRTTNTGESVQNLSVSDIADIASDSVVEITTETVENGTRMGQYIAQGAGSGVIITTDGYIATNNHVIEGASKISVRLANGQSYDATLVGTDAQTDLAVIKIETTDLTPAVLGTSSTLKVGELAVAIGNPLGELGGTVTNGIISALDREVTIDGENMTLLQTNAAINPGNSGGGLFNSAGELIGIVNAKSSGTDVEGLGFAIPVDTAKIIISELMENGYISGRPTLGISVVDFTNTATAMRYRVSQLGVYVAEVTDGSSFEVGDLIKSMDGEDIASSTDITSILSNHKVGDTISTVVVRNNKEQTLNITVNELKQ